MDAKGVIDERGALSSTTRGLDGESARFVHWFNNLTTGQISTTTETRKHGTADVRTGLTLGAVGLTTGLMVKFDHGSSLTTGQI